MRKHAAAKSGDGLESGTAADGATALAEWLGFKDQPKGFARDVSEQGFLRRARERDAVAPAKAAKVLHSM
jgi:hypothetical protein